MPISHKVEWIYTCHQCGETVRVPEHADPGLSWCEYRGKLLCSDKCVVRFIMRTPAGCQLIDELAKELRG